MKDWYTPEEEAEIDRVERWNVIDAWAHAFLFGALFLQGWGILF